MSRNGRFGSRLMNSTQTSIFSIYLGIHFFRKLNKIPFLQHQNGFLVDALTLWKKNVDKRFEGVEECYICFFILHGSTYQMPKVACPTCKKKFHSACLYKWFSTSQNSTCPLCRNLFWIKNIFGFLVEKKKPILFTLVDPAACHIFVTPNYLIGTLLIKVKWSSCIFHGTLSKIFRKWEWSARSNLDFWVRIIPTQHYFAEH